MIKYQFIHECRDGLHPACQNFDEAVASIDKAGIYIFESENFIDIICSTPCQTHIGLFNYNRITIEKKLLELENPIKFMQEIQTATHEDLRETIERNLKYAEILKQRNDKVKTNVD